MLCAVNVDRNPALIEIQVRVLESPIASTVLYRYRVVLFRRRLRSHARPPYLPAAFCFPTQRAHALSPYRTRRERRARALGFKRSCKLYRYCEQLDARRGFIHVRRQERYRLFVFHRVRQPCTKPCSSHRKLSPAGLDNSTGNSTVTRQYKARQLLDSSRQTSTDLDRTPPDCM